MPYTKKFVGPTQGDSFPAYYPIQDDEQNQWTKNGKLIGNLPD
jgi:hypothetical protein